jgi:hypothetical protein
MSGVSYNTSPIKFDCGSVVFRHTDFSDLYVSFNGQRSLLITDDPVAVCADTHNRVLELAVGAIVAGIAMITWAARESLKG